MVLQRKASCFVTFCSAITRPIRHDSSMGHGMYPTVWSLRGPGHDSSMGHGMYPTVRLFRDPGSIPHLSGVA